MFTRNSNPATIGTIAVIMLCGTFAIVGCGKTSGSITLQNSAFGLSTSARAGFEAFALSSAATTISSFSFCVREVKLEAEDGNAVRKDGDSDDLIEVRLGLISPNDGLKTLSWGTADIPVGTAIKKIKVQIHKDKELCGVDYSVKMNDLTLTKDIEFKFTFPKGTVMEAGKTITFDLQPIVAALSAAYSANEFNDSAIEKHLKAEIEGVANDE